MNRRYLVAGGLTGGGLALWCFVLAAALSGAADAGSLDDYLGNGYSVARTLRLSAAFKGCKKGQTIIFADGSRFTCRETQMRTASGPRAYLLRLGAEPPSVMIIGGGSYGGSITRLGNRELSTPLPMGEDDSIDTVRPDHSLQTDARIVPLSATDDGQSLKATRPSDQEPAPLAGTKQAVRKHTED